MIKDTKDVICGFVIIFVLIISVNRVAPERREISALLSPNNSRNQVERKVNMELIEQFKQIKDYEGLYEVSNFGRVKSLCKTWHGKNNAQKEYPEKILKQKINPQGYFMIGLSKENVTKWFNIHNLVWDHFGDTLRDGYKLQVDHIDNYKLNNRIDNLQLLTNRQNTTKAMLSRLKKSSKYVGVSYDKSRDKWIVQIQINHKSIHLGRYDDEDIAGQVYQNALREYEAA